MRKQLLRADIDAERHPGILPQDVDIEPVKTAVMQRRTPGAIGCHYSQVGIMEEAFKRGQNAWVMEDDLIFCEDFQLRLKIIDLWMQENEWDVFWLGGTFHSPAFWHKIGVSGMQPNCSAQLGKDCEPTDDPRFIRTYGAFCTYAYIVNYKSLDKVLSLLDQNVSQSIGIDWLFIKLQPQLKTFAFVPGSVKQMDNKSDIGDGDTIFSGFSRLNGTIENSRYWYQEKMEDFNPINYKWI